MKSLEELKNNNLSSNLDNIMLCMVKNLPNKLLDMDVYLPSVDKYLQRRDVWSLLKKRNLIMSILLDRHIPPIYAISSFDKIFKDERYQIIDGKQRLNSIIKFLDGKFQIEIDDELYYIYELPQDYQFKILNYPIMAQVKYEPLDKEFTDKEKIEWFQFVNFFDTPQDIVHLQDIINTYKFKNNGKF